MFTVVISFSSPGIFFEGGGILVQKYQPLINQHEALIEGSFSFSCQDDPWCPRWPILQDSSQQLSTSSKSPMEEGKFLIFYLACKLIIKYIKMIRHQGWLTFNHSRKCKLGWQVPTWISRWSKTSKKTIPLKSQELPRPPLRI